MWIFGEECTSFQPVPLIFFELPLYVAIENVMSEIDLFVSSTGNFTLILVLVCSMPMVSHLRCAGAHAGSPGDSR